MRRLIYLFSLIAALFVVGCEKQMPDNVINNKLVEVCIVADADADDESRVALDGNTTTWVVGDRITVALQVNFSTTQYAIFEIKSSSDISASGKRARFYGEVPTGEYYRVTALYPAVDNPSNSTTLDRNAADNIFMSSHIVSYDSPVLVVKEDKEVELPLTFSHLMHKMDFNLSLADGYSSNDLNSNNIAVEISAVSGSNEVSFDMTKSFNMITGATSTTSTTKTILAYGKSPQFSTMLFPMGLTRDVVFTFGVYIDGEKRYEVRKPESGTIESIRMDAGRSTTVNLVLSNKNSISGGEDITAEPITLTASKNTIDANGVDSVKLSVVKTNGGEDVTAQSTIYVNGSKLNGSTFLTTAAGTYTIRAERYGVESNTVTITAKAVTNTGKTIVFAEGVTLTSGWYDVNKKSTTNNSGADAMMCWAASSSNIIQWFQDRYVADGNTLPAGCPNGTSSSYDYELQIMDVFRDNWDNLARGNWTDGGVIWYMEGRNVYETNGKESCAYPRSGTGGYFKSRWSSIYANMYKYDNNWSWYTGEPYTYATEINNYNWRGSSIADPLLKFSEYIVTAFEYGISSMAVAMSSNFGGAHAVTIWGYEIDNATGYVTKLYIADSDDGSTPVLQPYTVSPEGGNAKIVLNGYTTYYPFALYPMSGYASAN